MDEERRKQRSVGDMHVMEKSVERVKVKNLEAAPGIDAQPVHSNLHFPTDLNTAHEKLVDIASGIGFNLCNCVEIVDNVQHLKSLEAARFFFFFF